MPSPSKIPLHPRDPDTEPRREVASPVYYNIVMNYAATLRNRKHLTSPVVVADIQPHSPPTKWPSRDHRKIEFRVTRFIDCQFKPREITLGMEAIDRDVSSCGADDGSLSVHYSSPVRVCCECAARLLG